MTTTNDITGDRIVSRYATDSFRANWDAAFGPKPTNKVYIEESDDGYTNIIVDYHDNQNCALRLNKEQFEELKRQLNSHDNSYFGVLPDHILRFYRIIY